MDHQKQALKLGACVLIFAVFLRLFGGVCAAAATFLKDPQLAVFAIFLQTGRVIRPSPSEAPTVPSDTEPPPSTGVTAPPEDALPVFSEEDLNAVSLIYGCDYRPDLDALLQAPLSWDLTDGAPAVLILHTHGTEAYTATPDTTYLPWGNYRTLDQHYNMVSIGAEVARLLEQNGISVIHDHTLHDYPSYSGSYSNARKTIQSYLDKYPSIRMVLDIHRDALSTDSGKQLTTSAIVGGQKSAQIMLVMGTDAAGNRHPNWQANLALALKLTAQLERTDPGITRPIYLRSERFNMDMTPGSLLVEIGASGNTHEEAVIAAHALARGIIALAKGTS